MQEVELKCDTLNDTNTYYVVDGNLGLEHELHGSIQFKVVNENRETTYESHIFSADYFIKQFKIFEQAQWDKSMKQMAEGLKKAIETDTLYFFKDGKMVKFSELNNSENEER